MVTIQYMVQDIDRLKQTNIDRIAQEGVKIYEQVKAQYDPREKGKFLAIEIESKKVYLGATSAEAVESALQEHPNKIFYIVKIGYDSAESIAQSFLGKR